MFEEIIENVKDTFFGVFALELSATPEREVHEKGCCVFVGVLRECIFLFSERLNNPLDQVIVDHDYLRFSSKG